MKPDFETKIRYPTTPPTMEVVACTKRGAKFMEDWMNDDDEPDRDESNRPCLLMLSEHVRGFLLEAARSGLSV